MSWAKLWRRCATKWYALAIEHKIEYNKLQVAFNKLCEEYNQLGDELELCQKQMVNIGSELIERAKESKERCDKIYES